VEFQPSLFAPDPLPVKQMLAPRIEALKQQDIFIGTSSWRYEGWLGQIYTPERYFTRGKFTAPFTIARALLRPGRSYEHAVRQFAPYKSVQDEYPEGRRAIGDLIDASRSRKMQAYIHINNRFEGNAIETISASIP
jgi:hypothetical protein